VTDATVDTRSGKVSGTFRDARTEPGRARTRGTARPEAADGNGVHVFRGIPYAAPPTGPRRYRAPQPPDPWTDVRECLDAGPVAPQPPSPFEAMLGAPSPHWDEDCLTLNVWTPGLDDARRPVMVWIHGGAFVNGSGSTPWYDGTRFAQHGDLVVVTINYRLGALGFLHLAPFDRDRFADAGNCGLLDQIAALEWVRDNIENFGGDPSRVTVFGESAGGMSVGTLLGMPAAQGLFARAIVQSGSASFVADEARATRIAERLLAKLDLDPSRVDEIETIPAQAVVDAQSRLYDEEARTQLPFVPVVDGLHIPRPPLEAIAAGDAGDVPLLIGTNAHEMTLFLLLDPSLASLDEASLTKRAVGALGERGEEAARLYTSNRPGAPLGDALIALESDRVFRIPAIRLAEAEVRAGRPVHMYLFAWETPAFGGALRSAHALELPFVWDALDQNGVGILTGDGPERQALATRMHRHWIEFARTGEPGWPEYDLESRRVVVFDGEGERVVADPAGDERRLWDGVG